MEGMLTSKASLFLSKIFDVMSQMNCEVGSFDLDHICFRTNTIEEYQNIKQELLAENELLSANEHNGREISVFKLKRPISFEERSIPVFELPAPKDGCSYLSGYEHIEFVIPYTLRELVENNPHLNFNIKNIDDDENPSVKLKFSCGVVKFHVKTLEEVVAQ